MMEATFEQAVRKYLKESHARYPAMEQDDAVKFVFQAMLGVGHLLSSHEAVEEYIAREMKGLIPAPNEPLLEPLSPIWARLNLRKALAENIHPAVIADYMFASKSPILFSRSDVFDFCMKIAEGGDPLLADTAMLCKISDETWLPSHSPTYQELYHPAYRVVSREVCYGIDKEVKK